MLLNMSKSMLGFCLTLIFFIQTAYSTWEFAVTSKTKILFYDEHWHEVTSSAHQFDQLSALTFDETEEIIYFNDQLHNNGSIFSLKIPISSDPHVIEKIVQRTQNESIRSIAYDPLNRNLYWSDALTRKIYFTSIDIILDATELPEPKVLIDFTNEESVPDGIALDLCRRKLYWTNSNFKNATIESIELDGTDREVIVRGNLFLPHGIIVDQLSDRIYWVVDQQGVHFSVESANLDGSDRRVIVKGLNNVPFSLAVTKDAIFWTDLTHNAVWSHTKFVADLNATETVAMNPAIDMNIPHKVLSFAEDTRGIVARTHFFQTLQNDEHCAVLVNKIKQRMLTPKATRSPVDMQLVKMRRDYCLNGGDYSEKKDGCMCKIGYKGSRCESSDCHNYCVHGTCSMSSMGYPKCGCQYGFYGERCEIYKCTGFCYNDGVCKIEGNGEPMCECRDNYGGQRCELNSTEICSLFCRISKYEPDTYVPFGCRDICAELSEQTEDGAQIYALPQYKHLEVCRNSSILSTTVIIVIVVGVVICLCLVNLIIFGLRRFYKPARPRIKKTFVVRKQATNSGDTPLTNRPMATEQCEIIIENCCNMNICETPCFDPKLVQQTLSRDGKEDKKLLIHNMEDELY